MRLYFYKVDYNTKDNTGRSHWGFGSYENKIALEAALHENGVSDILTIKQLFAKYSEDEVKKIVRNVLVYQPRIIDKFPDEILKLLM